MKNRDMPLVMDIENESFEFPWSEKDFTRCLRHRNCIGMVAECYDPQLDADEISDPLAFMIFENHRTRLHVLNFAVSPWCRRLGIGRQLIEQLNIRLSDRCSRIMLEIRETNLEAQLFFKSADFRAVSILKNYYNDSDEDAYLMRYGDRPIDHDKLKQILADNLK